MAKQLNTQLASLKHETFTEINEGYKMLLNVFFFRMPYY